MKQRKTFLRAWMRAAVKRSMTVSAGTSGRAVLHASMWGVQELSGSWGSAQLPSCLTFMLSFQDVLNPKVM